MTKVLVSLKVFPTGVEVNLEKLKSDIKESLPKYASVYKFEDEPIAFGLIAVIAHILIPEDNTDGIDKVETNIRKISDIRNFQTIMVRRV